MPRSREDFVSFIRETLIPDLRESGRDATADDFETCCRFMTAKTVDIIEDHERCILDWAAADAGIELAKETDFGTLCRLEELNRWTILVQKRGGIHQLRIVKKKNATLVAKYLVEEHDA